MEFNIFGKKVTVGKGNSAQTEKNFINYATTNLGLDFLGSRLSDCGNIRIDTQTMYRIHKQSKMAFAYKNKIAQMVARGGIEVYNEKQELLEDSSSRQQVELLYEHIGGKHMLNALVNNYFDEAFCNGQVFAVPSQINGLVMADEGSYLKILDGRGMSMNVDKYGVVKNYKYTTRFGTEDFIPDELLDQIVYKDIDYARKGLSIYNSVAMEAITNEQANKTQMYFFKHGAKPNVYIALNPEPFKGVQGKENKKTFDEEWEAKYGGSNNAGKTISSHLITDIKTLDMSNVDLDLVKLRQENDNAFSAIFLLDIRLIGLQKETGSYGEVESTTIRQGNEQIEAYSKMFSDFLTSYFKKFINPAFTFELRALSSKFKNVNEDKKVSLLEVEAGTLSRNEHRMRFDEQPVSEKNMDKYTMKNGLTFVDDPLPGNNTGDQIPPAAGK